MTWFRLDDDFFDHPKVLRIPKARREAALMLWFRAGTWSSRKQTDGNIPASLPEEYDKEEYAQDLVNADLWEITDDGWHFHDWEVYRAPVITDEERETRSEAASRAANIRWERERAKAEAKATSTPPAQPEDAPGIPGACDPHALGIPSACGSMRIDASYPYPLSNPTPNSESNSRSNSNSHTTRARPREREPAATLIAVPPQPRRFSAEFEAFWSVYPKQYDQPRAWNAWNHALLRAQPDEIITAAQRYAADPNLIVRFAPKPANWLDGDGWNNAPCPPLDPPSKPNRRVAATLEAGRRLQALQETRTNDSPPRRELSAP